jgi:stearoyl-CoA desaturase (delta-9 desaturase)
MVFFVPFAWKWVGLCVALYYLRMFGITAGFHRYYAHRTFKTGRALQFALAWLGSMSLQKGVLWWAAHHRFHHRFSDQDEDIHSPTLRGFLWAHMGWILSPEYEETDFARIRDFAKYPELRWLNTYHLVPGVLMFVAVFLVWGLPGLAWSFLSTVLLWHGTFTINSLSHVFGKVRYRTTDTSKNNFWLALITLGEGWHNNHHYYQASANQGFFWWEVDGSYYAIWTLEKLGLVRDVKRPSKAVIEGNRIAAAA